MNGNLNIVLIGSSLNNHGQTNTPNFEDIVYINDLIDNVQIYLVDPNYYYSTIRSDEKSILEKELIEEIQSIENVNIIPNFYYFSELNFKENDNVIYICYIKEYNNSYKLMNLVNDHDVDNKYFIYNRNVKEIAIDYSRMDMDKYKSYNIYTGEKINDNYLKDEKEIYSLYNDAVDLILNYFDAGFNEEKNSLPNKKIPSYSYNTEIPILKGLISYYRLIPQNKNQIHRPSNEICESADYRKLITNILCKIVSNFVINNNILKIGDIEEYGWENRKTYEIIKNNILHL